MNIIKDRVINGPKGKPIVLDVFYEENQTAKPIVIFTHGFKGFKDWGHFNLVAEKFAHCGFVFIKFNLSHNGTTPRRPDEFVDPEAFGNNNFTIELSDLNTVINWFLEDVHDIPESEFDRSELYLLGHSRGGGISILKAEDKRVKKLATWASINEFGKYWDKDVMKEWKEKGVHYVKNSRTGQEMPMYYQIYEDFEENKRLLDIPKTVRRLQIPFLIVHGTDDESIPYQNAKQMAEWNKNAKLLTIEGGDHTFGAKHPWTADRLPEPAQHVVEETIEFFRS